MRKQNKKILAPQKNIFESILDLKSYVDEKDKYLIYKIDENKQFVFKTSKLKVKLAREIQRDGINYMHGEFCFFDCKHKRVKPFVTLTASTYNRLLQKEIALAILEYNHEGTVNTEVFWQMFNSAFKEINGNGDSTDFAQLDFARICQQPMSMVLLKSMGKKFCTK